MHRFAFILQNLKMQKTLWSRRYFGWLSFLFGVVSILAPRPEVHDHPGAIDLHWDARTSIAIRELNAGYGSFLGSLVWVKSIFVYAGILFEGDDAKPLPVLLNWVCDFDTSWVYPRLMAGWAIPQLRGFAASDALPFLEDGAKRFPDQWQFRITWAQYTLESHEIDSSKARDSAASILLPLSVNSSNKVPEYARNLAFTLLHKSGKPDEAMSILLQTYEQIPDPLIRFQFQNKIADLLQRNEVRFGASDSTAFFQAIGGMLDSKDPSQIGMAKRLLVRLVQPDHKASALAEAHQLAEQFKVYQKQAAAGR